MRFCKLAAMMFGLSAILAVSSFADVLTYTYSGSGSGTIGLTTFTDAAFTITGVDNTANVTKYGHGWFVKDDSTAISINGVGTFGLSTPLMLVDSTFLGFVGLGFPATSDFLTQGPFDSQFFTWNMLSSIGPITGPVVFIDWIDDTVETDAGRLVFTAFTSSVTFDATVVPVPEPGTMALLGSSLLGLSGVLRLKMSQSQ
jgi:hypothetical protein